MDVLRRAGDVPVSYAELNDAGVEFPASVVSELELAGVAIERCFGRGSGPRRLRGVRLAPAADPEPGPATQPSPAVPRQGDWEPVRVYRVGPARAFLEGALVGASRLVEPGQRWARRAAAGRPAIGSHTRASLALLAAAGVAAAGVAAAVTVLALAGNSGPRAHAARTRYYPPAINAALVIAAHQADRAHATKPARTRRRSPSAGRTSPTSTATLTATSSHSPPSNPATQPSSPPASPTPDSPTPDSSTSATGLEARGHELMMAGRYDQAIRILRRALSATGERPSACLQPTTQTCLTYAYALYNLGRSFRLAGKPAAAVPILKHRLRIDNQRRVVANELARARRQAHRRRPRAK